MACNGLHHFLNTLERLGELHRVPVPADPVLEIAEVTRRVCRHPGGGKALLFENVIGGGPPVATNVYGSYRRVARALGLNDLQDLTRHMGELLELHAASTLTGALFDRFRPMDAPFLACPEMTETEAGNIFRSALKGWPEDGRGAKSSGRFLTLPLVFTKDPETGLQNCGMYRVEIFDDRTCGIHWYPGSGGSTHCERYTGMGIPMPVAIVLGGDAAMILSAAMPLPDSVEEAAFAGFLRGSPVEQIRCGTSDIRVPAGAEVVIEGVVEPGETVQGGAFGNHTGFYRPGVRVPLLRILRVTCRRDAILPATVVGPPPMEDFFLGKAIERLMVPVLRRTVPEIVDMNLPPEGIFHGAVVVSIRNSRAGIGRAVIDALWEEGWLANSRFMVIVDADVTPHDLSHAAWWTLNHVDWSRDVHFRESSPQAELPYGGRIAIDATRKALPAAGELTSDATIQEVVTRRWRDYGLGTEW